MNFVQTRYGFSLPTRESLFSREGVGWLALFTSIGTSATYNSFAKELSQVLSPFTFLFISELLTAFFVLFSFGVLPTLRSIRKFPEKLWLPLLVVGVLNSVVAPSLFFIGLKSTSAINASLFSTSEVFFLVVMAVIFLGEKWTYKQAWATGFTAVGMAIVAMHGFQVDFHAQPGDGLILLSSLISSFGCVILRRYLHDVDLQIVILVRSLVGVAGAVMISSILLHPLADGVMSLPGSFLPLLFTFAFISRFLNLFVFYVSIDRLSVATVSLLSSLNIVAGPVFAHFTLGESLAWYHFAGGMLILFGTLVLEFAGAHPSHMHLQRHLEQRVHHRA